MSSGIQSQTPYLLLNIRLVLELRSLSSNAFGSCVSQKSVRIYNKISLDKIHGLIDAPLLSDSKLSSKLDHTWD